MKDLATKKNCKTLGKKLEKTQMESYPLFMDCKS